MTFQAYVGTKIIQAEPQEKDGIAGYAVVYPDGYASWSPRDTFEAAYREISHHERQLVEMTDAEAQVSAISDGDPEHCEHDLLPYSDEKDGYPCSKCPHVAFLPF